MLIIPIEEQTSAVGAAKEDRAAPSMPERAEVGPETESQEGSRAEEEERSAEPMLSPLQSKGASKPVTKLKKVISRKKAGKQARTIIVT